MLDLLKRLIANERRYAQALDECRASRSDAAYMLNDDRGEEIGWINGVNPRTVTALENMGLVETVDFGHGRSYVFLGSYRFGKPADELFK